MSSRLPVTQQRSTTNPVKQSKSTTPQTRKGRNITPPSTERIERQEYQGRITRSRTRALRSQDEVSKYLDYETNEESEQSSVAKAPTPKKRAAQKKARNVTVKTSLTEQSTESENTKTQMRKQLSSARSKALTKTVSKEKSLPKQKTTPRKPKKKARNLRVFGNR